MACSSVDAQYFPSRNSITNAGTPNAVRMRRSRSFRTTSPGKVSAASRSKPSSSNTCSFMRSSHVPSDRQCDPAWRELLGRGDIPDVESEQLALREASRRMKEECDALGLAARFKSHFLWFARQD